MGPNPQGPGQKLEMRLEPALEWDPEPEQHPEPKEESSPSQVPWRRSRMGLNPQGPGLQRVPELEGDPELELQWDEGSS